MGAMFGTQTPTLAPRRDSDRKKRKILLSQDSIVEKIVSKIQTDDYEGSDSPDGPSEIGSGQSVRPGPVKKTLDRVLSFELDSVYMEAMTTRAGDYVFPFENLVFQGGGVKGYAYCGACSVLEEYGVMPQIRRYAGASIGSLFAAFLAIGYTSHEFPLIINTEFASKFKTPTFGYLNLIPNLFKMFGWNSFDPFYEWLGGKIAAKTDNPDITFTELYHKYGKELCVIVTNLNTMCEEYFHPKTTPDVPIRLAVKMSMTLPGVYQPTKFHHHGNENIYVDGGVLCNYPIHAFDGWWLSMKMEDRYLKRLQPLDECLKLYRHQERFGKVNPRTLGFKTFSHGDEEVDKTQLEAITPLRDSLPIPDTALGRKYKQHANLEQKTKEQHQQILNAVNAFLRTLEKYNNPNVAYINREELEYTLKDEKNFPRRYVERLFGENVSVDDVFDALDKDGNGKINLDELMYFIERTGVSVAARLFGHRWTKVDSAWSFLVQLQKTVLYNVMERTFRDQDLQRSVGINTGYIQLTDFDLEEMDKEFLFQEGRRHTDAYLRHYVVTKRPRKKSTAPETVPEEEEPEDTEDTVDDSDSDREEDGIINEDQLQHDDVFHRA